ncbi:NlpC/P60 family protein [Afifella sp. IM 167]|uniref:C40 family peptidase n=1 Tax=Afifella sp. IM 167 TaxID=2033586 RepID=UPI001CC94952|nr:peptidase P60 [Afifella sp. IM 167]
MSELDPRLAAYRPDLADSRLAGKVEAARFVEAEAYQVVDPLAPVRRAPSPDAPLDTEALRGEIVHVFELGEEGWAWGQLAADGYVGYLPSGALSRHVAAATHRVAVPSTLVFPGPDIKLPPLAVLPLGATVRVTGEAEDRNARYLKIAPAGAIVAQHLSPVGTPAGTDLVATAEAFLGTPYLWGGKSRLGIDCSGLVQIACETAGIACPRDSDMQANGLGSALDISAGLPPLQRGDFVFWKGHVGIMQDGQSLLHANVFHMAVGFEPLSVAAVRIAQKGPTITAIRRL